MKVRASLHRGPRAVQPRGCRSGRLQDLFQQNGQRLADVEHDAVFVWLQGLQGGQLAVEQAGRHGQVVAPDVADGLFAKLPQGHARVADAADLVQAQGGGPAL